MADLGAAAPTSAPRKNSPPIEDFGKDFLSSWKPSKGGDSMDFDVETVPRTGKSSFNFGKLDDFDFGGDFGKLSSFQMDMSDLDFSMPLKKTAKAKEKEPIPGKQDLKNDKFSFTFDFNELDKFDLDTNLVETEMPSSKSEDGPHRSDEVLKNNKDLDTKSNLFSDGNLPENHGNETLPNRQSLPATTSANILGIDGPSCDAIAGHSSQHKEYCLDNEDRASFHSLKANTAEEEASGVRSPNSSPSRNSSPVKSSNSRSFPPKSTTASEDCSKTFWNREDDQHDVTGRNRSPPQEYIDASCISFPISELPGGATTSSKANSPLEVQETSKKDDSSHLASSISLRTTKENSNKANTPLSRVIKGVGVSEKSLLSKLAVSSITDKLPLKRKTFKEPLIDLKALDTFKHVNSSSKGRGASSSSTKSNSPNMVSAQSTSDTRKSPTGVKGSFQKDSKKTAPDLMTLRMSKVNIAQANSSMSRETNTVCETKENAESKLHGTFKTDEPNPPPLKTKTLEGAEKPDGSKSDTALENPSSINGTPELQNMDIEVPVLTENNGHIEKAESYSKELDDLCNMLKKKHEEAKELLVRAFVNNNELLMLNHPMVEERISFCLDLPQICRVAVQAILEGLISESRGQSNTPR